MLNLSDEALLAGLGSRDPDAAAAFVRRFQHRVFGLTQAILRDRGAAEEAAQETFVRAWRYAAAYDPRRGTASRGRAGTVFGYQGQPSWVMVTLQPSIQREGRFHVQVVTRDGRYLPLGGALLGGARGTWGGQLPVGLAEVHELRFLGPDGRTAFTATFDASNPWR